MSQISDLEIAQKLIGLSASAKDRGIEFNLSFKKLKEVLSRKTCYYTGVRFEETGPNKMSIDRVNSQKGYVDGNIVACTTRINGKKKDLSFEDIEILYNKMKAFKG